VLELATDPDARKRVLEECRAAVETDRAEVVVLGCAGMADLCAAASAELGVPVIDGVAAGTLLVQSLVTLGLRTSRRDEYAPPPPKAYAGLLGPFSLPE
jgi:allantoin racemase